MSNARSIIKVFEFRTNMKTAVRDGLNAQKRKSAKAQKRKSAKAQKRKSAKAQKRKSAKAPIARHTPLHAQMASMFKRQ
jgi:hypothetical protein